MADYIELPQPPLSCFDSLYVQKGEIVPYKDLEDPTVKLSENQKQKLRNTILKIRTKSSKGTGFIIKKHHPIYYGVSAAHVFGSPLSKELCTEFKVQLQSKLYQGQLIGHPWLSINLNDVFYDGDQGLDPITGFKYLMPNDVALFYFKANEALECLQFVDLP